MLASEIVIFGGLIACYIMFRLRHPEWAHEAEHTRLLAGVINTVMLLASGVLLGVAGRRIHRTGRAADGRSWFNLSLASGLFFVVAQGAEWLRLIQFGLTLRSSMYGSFFYLIVGAHAVHAVAALALMLSLWAPLRRDEVPTGRFLAAQVFWYFVVGIWPLIFGMVYLR